MTSPSEVIEDEEPFSSARSSFSSDVSTKAEHSGSELSSEIEVSKLPNAGIPASLSAEAIGRFNLFGSV